MEKSRGMCYRCLVVNQETNGGEPKQMLTGCLVNSTLPSGTGEGKKKKKKTRKRLKRVNSKKSHLNQIPLLADSQKFLLGCKFRVTSELNGLFIDRTNTALRWQGEWNYMSRLIWGDTDSEQSHVALQKFLHPEVLQGMLSRRQFYYLSQGSAGPEAAQR